MSQGPDAAANLHNGAASHPVGGVGPAVTGPPPPPSAAQLGPPPAGGAGGGKPQGPPPERKDLPPVPKDVVHPHAKVADMVREAVRKHEAAGSPSGQYMEPWYGRSGCKISALAVLGSLLAIAAIALFSWRYTEEENTPGGSPAAALITLTILVVIPVTCFSIVWFYPLDLMLTLNFRGTQILNLGATVILATGIGIVPNPQGLNAAEIGQFVGTSLMAVGIGVFWYTTWATQPWEFMFGSSLLFVAMLLRTAAAGLLAFYANQAYAAPWVDLAATPLFLLAIFFFASKAYAMMRRPWLSLPNYMMYGVACIGVSMLIFTSLSMVRLRDPVELTRLAPTALGKVAMVLIYVGTWLFLLASYRPKTGTETLLEDRYPSTAFLYSSLSGLKAAWVAAFGFLVASIVSFILWVSFSFFNEHRYSQGACQIVLGGCLLLLVVSFLPPFDHEPYTTPPYGRSWQVFSTFMCAACFILRGVSHLLAAEGIWDDVQQYKGTNIAASLVGIVGALGMGILFNRIALPSARIWPDPRTWENALHPCNFLLMGFLFLGMGAVLELAAYAVVLDGQVQYQDNLSVLGTVGCILFGIMLLLHLNLSHHLWETVHMPGAEGAKETRSRWIPVKEPSEVEDSEEYDVVISGAGPSGMLLACILGRQNVKTLVIDRRADIIGDARFVFNNCNTVEIWRSVVDADLLEELRQRGMPDTGNTGALFSTGLVHDDVKLLAGCVSPSKIDLEERRSKGNMDEWIESRSLGSRYCEEFPFRCMQSHTEAILQKQAQRLESVTLKYAHNVLGFDEIMVGDSPRVLTEYTTYNEDGEAANRGQVGGDNDDAGVGHRFKALSKYLVGADGPGSTVSKALGVHFDGFVNLARTRSILFQAPGLFEKVANLHGTCHQYQVVRKNYCLAGLVAVDPQRDLWTVPLMLGDKIRTDKAEDLIREITGTDNFTLLQDRAWYWNFFLSRSFRKGSVFLVGDSAHSWPPFGGTGGNTGYGDSFNLGWRLAMACKGQGSEALLEGFALERRQHALQTAMFVLRNVPRPELMKKFYAPVFDKPLVAAWMISAWKFKNSGAHSQNHFSQSGLTYGIKYNYSPTVVTEADLPPDDPAAFYTPAIMAGAKLPFLKLMGSDDMFAHIAKDKYSLLYIQQQGTDPNLERVKGQLQAFKAAFAARDRELHTDVVALPTDAIKKTSRHELVQLFSKEALVLVRPDRIVAWRQQRLVPFRPVPGDRVEEIVSTATGLDRKGREALVEWDASESASRVRSYHAWLTRQFIYTLRPFTFQFPMAIPIENETKEQAIKKVKSQGPAAQGFTAVTKQGALHSDAEMENEGGASKVNDTTVWGLYTPGRGVVQYHRGVKPPPVPASDGFHTQAMQSTGSGQYNNGYSNAAWNAYGTYTASSSAGPVVAVSSFKPPDAVFEDFPFKGSGGQSGGYRSNVGGHTSNGYRSNGNGYRSNGNGLFASSQNGGSPMQSPRLSVGSPPHTYRQPVLPLSTARTNGGSPPNSARPIHCAPSAVPQFNSAPLSHQDDPSNAFRMQPTPRQDAAYLLSGSPPLYGGNVGRL